MTKVPQGFDCSFLNDEEARKILQVLERNEALQRAEKERIRYRANSFVPPSLVHVEGAGAELSRGTCLRLGDAQPSPGTRDAAGGKSEEPGRPGGCSFQTPPPGQAGPRAPLPPRGARPCPRRAGGRLGAFLSAWVTRGCPAPRLRHVGGSRCLGVRPSRVAGRSGVPQAAAWRGPGGQARPGRERGLGRRGRTCLQSPPGRPLSPHTLLEKPPLSTHGGRQRGPGGAGTSLKAKCFPPQGLDFEELAKWCGVNLAETGDAWAG